jgi:hypothetical protein
MGVGSKSVINKRKRFAYSSGNNSFTRLRGTPPRASISLPSTITCGSLVSNQDPFVAYDIGGSKFNLPRLPLEKIEKVVNLAFQFALLFLRETPL